MIFSHKPNCDFSDVFKNLTAIAKKYKSVPVLMPCYDGVVIYRFDNGIVTREKVSESLTEVLATNYDVISDKL